MWQWIKVAAAVFGASVAAAIFSVSDIEYQNVLPRLALTRYLIKSFKLAVGGLLGPNMILECSRRCAALPSCTSFILQPSTHSCFLINLDRCRTKDTLLLKRKGFFYYEKFEAAEVPPPTCYASCLKHMETCEECGRPNCWGEFCQHCASSCWERRNMSEEKASFLAWDMKHRLHTTCSGSWQLWWTTGTSPPRKIYHEPLMLHVVIIYADGGSLGAYFDMVQMKNRKLSVGNMIRDDGAGNWWEAPFDMRPLRFFPSGNCVPFYTPSNTCVSHTVPPAEEQFHLYNGTVKYRGFPWLTGNENYDNIKIKKIELWITCLQCVNQTLSIS